MEPFKKHKGIAVPLDRANVDTDMIIPKQFLRSIKRTGFGKNLFHELRYLDYEGTKENPDFPLNQDPYRRATVLLTRDNFGCGSSREHAPWALCDYGFRVIIAPSFADIFYNNCVKNGILLIKLNPQDIENLFAQVTAKPGVNIEADLEKQAVLGPDGKTYSFEIQSFAKHCLWNGLDQIGWTLQFSDKIENYEDHLATEKPWLA